MIKLYRMPLSVLGLLSAAVILFGASVDAQTLRTPQESPEPVKVTNKTLTISVNQSRSIDLGVGVTQAHITNEGVADVRIVPMGPGNPPKAFIIAKSVGATNMFFFTKDGNQVHHFDVRVTLDHQGLEEALAELLGRRSVKVSVFRDTVYLKGSVRSASESAKAVAIARRFVPTPDNLVNLLSVQGSQQVMLQVRVAEIKRTVRKALTVNQNFSQTLTDDKLINFSSGNLFPTDATSFVTGTIITQLSGFGPTNFEA